MQVQQVINSNNMFEETKQKIFCRGNNVERHNLHKQVLQFFLFFVAVVVFVVEMNHGNLEKIYVSIFG